MKIIFLILFSLNTYAGSINIDIGQTNTVYNRFSIPKSNQDEIVTPTDETLNSFRLTGYFDLQSKNQIYFLLAPLEVEYNFDSEKAFTFNDTDFLNSTETKVLYKFNSYRLGYLWTWEKSALKYWSGVVGKIRDARIKVSQGSNSDSFDNIGFVPLLAFGFDWRIIGGLSLFSHTDGLGSTQGSAYDSQLEIKYSVGDYGVSLGKRILGGGADNDTVYSFAQFDTYYLRFISYF